MKLTSAFPSFYNFVFRNNFLQKAANKAVGFHPEEHAVTRTNNPENLVPKKLQKNTPVGKGKKVYFFFAMSLLIVGCGDR